MNRVITNIAVLMMVLVLIMSVCVMPTFAAEIQSNTVSANAETLATDFVYTVLSDGTAEIAGYTGTDTEIIIPSTIDGYKVTSIGNSAFFKNIALTEVTIPSGVKSIGNYAFGYCTSLRKITIPSSVASIAQNAFSNHSTDLVIYCFKGTSALKHAEQNGIIYACFKYRVLSDNTAEITAYYKNATDVEIPSNVDGYVVTSIGEQSFIFSGVESVTIPDTVTKIGDYAFCQCSSLTSVTMPENLTYLGDYAFGYCSSLPEITIPNGVPWIGECAFGRCSSLRTITIPEGTEFIDNYAFMGCTSLIGIYVPSSVEYIDGNAFIECSGSLIIYGCTGSYAQTFAEQNGIGFIASDIAKL